MGVPRAMDQNRVDSRIGNDGSSNSELLNKAFEVRCVGAQADNLVEPALGGGLLVRIHSIIVMIRWTGLAAWEYLVEAALGGGRADPSSNVRPSQHL